MEKRGGGGDSKGEKKRNEENGALDRGSIKERKKTCSEREVRKREERVSDR